MALGALSAAGSYVSLGGVALCMSEWEVRIRGNTIDSTSFCDGGFGDRIPGVLEAEIRVKGLWNSLQNPHSLPPGIFANATLANLALGPQSGLPVAYVFPVIIVDEVMARAVVREGVEFEFTAHSRGTFSYPV